MALTFDYEKSLATGTQPFICHEKDSTIYNYYIADELAMDKSAIASLGQYDTVTFTDEERHLTTKAVSRIGVKNFPGIGGIGFYRDAYSDENMIVAPIHLRPDVYNAPVLTTVEIVDDKLHIVITPPENIAYTCYRVIVRQQAFAFEYIVYKTDYLVDVPTVKGEYTCYCIGYDEDAGTISDVSNELSLTVETGSADWSPDSLDTADVEKRLAALEEEVKSYSDEEIAEDVAYVIETATTEEV